MTAKGNKSTAIPEDTLTTSIDDVQEAIPEAKSDAEDLAVTDHGDNFCGDKVELVINSGVGDAGKQAVFIGVNGYGFNIPRDIPVIVPTEVVDQLANCVETQYESIAGGKMVEREVRRFSFSSRAVRNK